MKRLILIFILVSTAASAQVVLSEKAQVSVITCGPWQGELYSAFGHSAFRVYDPVNRVDYAYNYGVFDFDQPHFYLNFALGNLLYQLGVYYYRDFEYYYIHHNRYVHEQVLNLDSAQRQKMFNYLQWNNEPENQQYRYDYFYNNCATKMRDVVRTVFPDSVTFDGSYIKTDYTIRELTDLYIEESQPWGDLGIDICLGLPMDKTASPLEYMFLPDYVEQGFDHATIKHNGKDISIVARKNIIFEPPTEKFSRGINQPLYVFTAFLLVVIGLTYRDFKRRKISKWLDLILFGMLGALGVLLFFLWVATDHNAAAKNFNLLWALPTHIVAIFFLAKRPDWIKKYFLGVTVVTAFLLVTWAILPQQLHFSLIPLAIAIGIRSWTEYKL